MVFFKISPFWGICKKCRRNKYFPRFSRADNDVVDWDVDQFHEKTNEAHDGEANGCCNGDLLEFCKRKILHIKSQFLITNFRHGPSIVYG